MSANIAAILSGGNELDMFVQCFYGAKRLRVWFPHQKTRFEMALRELTHLGLVTPIWCQDIA